MISLLYLSEPLRRTTAADVPVVGCCSSMGKARMRDEALDVFTRC